MFKYISLAFLASVSLFGFASEVSPSAIVFKDKAFDIVSAIPLNEETVIKFDGDTLRASLGSWSTSVVKTDFETVEHGEAKSPLSMKVTLRQHPDVIIEDASILLTPENSNDDELHDQTDQNGEVVFKETPAGIYEVLIQPNEIFFNPRKIGRLIHGYDSNYNITLFENVLLPYELSYELINEDDESYCIDLNWLMNPSEPVAGPFRDYIFKIYLNGEYIGQTSDTNFKIEKVLPGEYIVGVSSLSSYGNQSTGCSEITVLIGSIDDSFIKSIEAEESSEVYYYDLNGRQVSRNHLTPGLYIRRTPDSVTKILIP